jgi:hypothetical protein
MCDRMRIGWRCYAWPSARNVWPKAAVGAAAGCSSEDRGLRLTSNGRRLLSLATLLDAKYDSVHLNAKYPQLGVAEAPISVSLRRPYRSAACALSTLRPTGQPISARPWKRG